MHLEGETLYAEAKSICDQSDEQRFSVAFPIMLRAAKLGSISAQFQIGLMYGEGLGAMQNLVLARQWLQLAATNKHPDAPSRLDELVTWMNNETNEKRHESQLEATANHSAWETLANNPPTANNLFSNAQNILKTYIAQFPSLERKKKYAHVGYGAAVLIICLTLASLEREKSATSNSNNAPSMMDDEIYANAYNLTNQFTNSPQCQMLAQTMMQWASPSAGSEEYRLRVLEKLYKKVQRYNCV